MTKKEIKNRIEELEEAYTLLNAEQLSIKNIINSIYGVFGNKYFYFVEEKIAESITSQGRHIIKSTAKVINDYFANKWALDTKLHEVLGITNVKAVENDVWIYTDTDSVFISFEEVYNNCDGWEGNEMDFVLSIYNNRLNKYLLKFFEKYANNYNTASLLNLEMEKIIRSGIFFGKKMYAFDLGWKDPNVYYDPCEKVSIKGHIMIKKQTPRFPKQKLKELLDYILLKGKKNVELSEIMKMVGKIKEEFKLQDRDNISGTIGISGYEDYVLNDTTEMKFKKGTPSQVKSSLYYNYLLNTKYIKYKNKYQLIKSGMKVKYYHTKTEDENLKDFAYIPGSYPFEYAPEIDYDKQFDRVFLTPLNSILETIGYNPVSPNLISRKALF